MTTLALPVIVSIDLGTSGCQVAAFDGTGACIGSSQAPYVTRSPEPGRAEQAPEEWWRALCAAFRQVMNECNECHTTQKHIVGISLTAQMAGLVLVGNDGQPLGPALTWMDVRAGREAERLYEVFGAQTIYERTGCPPRPHYSLPKLVWFKEQTDVFEHIRWCFSPKDYIFWRLTGEPLTDPSTAGASQLMNVATREWDDELVAWLELPLERLPRISASVTSAPLQPTAASELGLQEASGGPSSGSRSSGGGSSGGGSSGSRSSCGRSSGSRSSPNVPVILGAGDGVCANLGSGALEAGTAACNVGTSAAVRVVTEAPTPDAHMRTALYPSADELWVSNLATNNAGAVLAWFAEAFYGDRTAIDQLFDEAETVKPGAEGLLFLPYVFSERSPKFMPPGVAQFIGVSGAHRRAHFARAVVEGVAFTLRVLVETLRQTVPMDRLTVTGGVSSSRLFRQILADVTGLPVHCTKQIGRETGLGAAIIGFVAVGHHATFRDAVREMVEVTETTNPTPGYRDRYERNYERFLAWRETLLARMDAAQADGSAAKNSTMQGEPNDEYPRAIRSSESN